MNGCSNARSRDNRYAYPADIVRARVTHSTVSYRPFDGREFEISGSDGDVGILGEIERSGGRYQADLASFLRRTLRRDSLVVDGGAHVGVITILVSSLCPNGRVYAFEPVAASREYLQRNLAANNVANVVVEEAALYDVDGEIPLEFNAGQPGGSHIANTGTMVPSSRIDSWARRRHVERLDVLKLDVEGAELHALAGAEETLAALRPTTVVECNPVALRRFGRATYRDLFERMSSLFRAVGVIGSGGTFVPLRSADRLQAVLGEHGVVDLVGLCAPLDARAAITASMRSGADTIGRAWRTRAGRRPVENMVFDPRIVIAIGGTELSGSPAEWRSMRVVFLNRTRWWLSSSFPYHPVHAAYRWLDESGVRLDGEGERVAFPAPLGPGESVVLDVAVTLPATPGRYQLEVTLVQEAFAWFDDLDPACAARVAVIVQSPRTASTSEDERV
jgi:FkbM family methyltransferase